MVQTVKSRKS